MVMKEKVGAGPDGARRAGGKAVISTPSKTIFPDVERNSPDSWATRVVLPAPFGPITAWTSAWPISRSMSELAAIPPKCFVRPLTLRSGSVTGPAFLAQQERINAAPVEQDHQ